MEQARTLRILHLEDDREDAELVRRALDQADLPCQVHVAACYGEYLDALDNGKFEVVLSDSSLPGSDALSALHLARQRYPDVPFLFVSGQFDHPPTVHELKAAGAADCLLKSELERLAPAIRRAVQGQRRRDSPAVDAGYLSAMERLVAVVQELSLARDLESIMVIVRRAARELTGADGATFVLRDGDRCYYADEDAIAPLWKGQRFPMSTCISGWVMMNRKQAVIEDIYVDPRIPHDAYRPTFVKSLVMVPIRALDPMGAIGNYWAQRHTPTRQEVKLLQALADTTAVAMENVQVYDELEQRVKTRTAELEAANKELETFSYAVSHDLRAPLRHIDGFARIILEDHWDALDEQVKAYIDRMRGAVRHMSGLIEDLLTLSRTTQTPVRKEKVDLSPMAATLLSGLQGESPDRRAEFVIPETLPAHGDPGLLRMVMDNLLSNAWKFTSKVAVTRIEVGQTRNLDGQSVYFVRDNGAGFDGKYAERAFMVFHRLHGVNEFPGTGIGLATVQRIITKHGGRIWADAEVDRGATFYFTLP